MTKLLLICVLQSSTSVAGAMLLGGAFGHSPQSIMDYLQASVTGKGLTGMVLMLLSFVVLSYALSQYKPSTFIPVNTATTFIATIALAYILGHDRVSYTAAAGMLLIGSGITLVIRAQ